MKDDYHHGTKVRVKCTYHSLAPSSLGTTYHTRSFLAALCTSSLLVCATETGFSEVRCGYIYALIGTAVRAGAGRIDWIVRMGKSNASGARL